VLPNSPERINTIEINSDSYEYSPVDGIIELREKVANYYNRVFRNDKKSKYTFENVSISGGGRSALIRIAASLGNINMGYFIPDYTDYEELLSIFKAFTPIPILLSPENGYTISLKDLKNEITGRGLGAMLMSNPCNPTGQLVYGNELKERINIARKYNCTMIFDEFYSHYIYGKTNNKLNIISGAEFVEDVNKDPIIIVDGLTKNWRYPGWRISWTLGPKEVIEKVASAGSFLDGGACNPFQHHTLQLLDLDYVKKESSAIQKCFKSKRDFTIKRLKEMNIKVEFSPMGSFYVWANLSNLPNPLNDGMELFKAGLNYKVITVPGTFFDVNPGKCRSFARYNNYSRISFGVEMAQLKKGLDKLEYLIQSKM
jgi:aspartate/methionine/tyrosine aminotransferase